ncbi:MAG: membrane protein insertase YidC [Fluviicola sp.]
MGMDKNTVIGLSLIGVLLVAFTIMSQPSEAEIKAQKKKELNEKKKKEAEAKSKEKEKQTATPEKIQTASAEKEKDSNVVKAAAPVQVKEEFLTLESDKLIVEVSTKGAVLSSVQLKEYESYANYVKNDGKITPVYLFRREDNVNELVFNVNGKKYSTGNKAFEVVEKTKDKLVLKHAVENGSVEFTYALKDGYNLDYSLAVKDLNGVVQPNSVMFNWNTKMQHTERMLTEQRRVSTICFQNNDGQLDYLNEMSDDNKALEMDANWLAFKQSYFSSILHPENPFKMKGSKVSIKNFKSGDKEFFTHIKTYKATMNLGLSSTKDGLASFNWYFGPNDYDVLASYDSGYDDILNWGWGIFRWINLYAVQPLFDWLMESGLAAGLAILLLTLILKLILMPIQWKMFVSSAKMRILKPEIDAINAKYPNKEDAMKKQMDMMTLYRESGASPLAGCVPMLFQMPILLAVFRFFPASFDLRQKSFLWAEDLSSYDSIWDFGTYIPVYGNHMSLFTLLMSATTLIYTYLNSSNVAQQQQPGMPNMKVIMYIFPVMMIFFFNNYSAGLSYYYFISTLMTILLMFAIKRFFVDEAKLKEKMAAMRVKSSEKSKNPKKKSGFMQRLEDMQRQQQEQMKNKKK